MSELLVGGGVAVGAGVLGHLWRRRLTRAQAERRISARLDHADDSTVRAGTPTASVLKRHLWLPWILGAAISVVLLECLGLRVMFAVTFGVIIGTIGTLLESHLAARRELRFETQLVDALDLMVGSLRAGGSLMQSLEGALLEASHPLRGELEELVGRIRLGDEPRQVLRVLALRVPLETFQLFVTALTVHVEVGGSLAPTLATVGRTIRDRIELARKVRAQSTQAQTSVVAMLLISYFIAAVMWRTNPDRMARFLATDLGAAMFTSAILFQAIGLLMMKRLSRIEI